MILFKLLVKMLFAFIIVESGALVVIQKLMKFLKSQRGFSLTEIMVGGAVLAGVALAGAKLLKDQKFAQKSVEHDQKLALWHSNLVKTMNETANCNATMKVVLPSAGALNANTNVGTLYKCVPGAGNKCEDDNNTTTDNSFDAYTPGAFAGTAMLAVNDYTDNTLVWQVVSMQFIDSRNTTGTSRLRITYAINPKIGKKRISKDIFMNLRFTGGSFKECINNKESSINNLQNDLCKSLNLSEAETFTSTGQGHIAVWDEATQTCKVTGTKDCSTQYNAQVEGIGDDGVVRCKPILYRDEGTEMANPAQSATCPVGQKPQMYWDGVAKKMVIRCSP